MMLPVLLNKGMSYMAWYQKRCGKWQARVSWMQDGKRHYKARGGFPTKTLAREWATKNEDSLTKGVDIGKSISFYDYYVRWVDTYKKQKVSRVSMVTYNTTAKNIHRFFHDDSIKSITRSQYQAFINQFGANHAPSTVQKINGFVRACVQSAILDDYLIKDFTQGVELVANKDKIRKVQYLNIREIKALLNAAENQLTPNSVSRYMIITAIYTGMRISEIQALTWNDIDWFNQTISINKSWDSVQHQFKPTKNPSSVRTIKVNPELLTILKQLKENPRGTMVFLNRVHSIPTSNAANKALRELLNQLGIVKRNFHFHSLRHSHVALLLANGIDIYAISKRLGHSNIKTTANTYAYLIDEYKYKTDKQIIRALSDL